MRPIIAVGVAAILLTSCQPPTHPNQINDFDGKTYDSFVLAHGALVTLRNTVATQHREFAHSFNVAADAYGAAFDAYAVYRVDPVARAQDVSLLTLRLASAVQALEKDLTNHLPANPAKVAAIQTKMQAKRGKMAASRPRYEMSLIDILTALQAASQIAQTIPAAGPYGTIALLVVNATKTAVENAKAHAGTPIDLALIAPVARI